MKRKREIAKERAAPVAVERREHHVRGVQRVDEVWREGVLLFHRVGPPAGEEKLSVLWLLQRTFNNKQCQSLEGLPSHEGRDVFDTMSNLILRRHQFQH